VADPALREADRNGDGKIDHWTWLDEEGAARRIGMDTNANGVVDRAQLMIDKRRVILKENDRNHDGKVDDRSLNRRGLDRQGVLRHIWIWKETDDNFDGIVDKFLKRDGVLVADTTGKPMGVDFTLEKPRPAAERGAPVTKTVRDLNQREAFERTLEASRKSTEKEEP